MGNHACLEVLGDGRLLSSADNSVMTSSAVARRLDLQVKLWNLSLQISYQYFVQTHFRYFVMQLNENVESFSLNEAD